MLGRIPFAVFRSACNGSKHFLNALTANFRTEVQETHPDIQMSLVSPGVVRTEFGKNALHGGVASRQLPYSQSAEEVGKVIADLIESRRPDVYTRDGSRERVIEYFSTMGEDPWGIFQACASEPDMGSQTNDPAIPLRMSVVCLPWVSAYPIGQGSRRQETRGRWS